MMDDGMYASGKEQNTLEDVIQREEARENDSVWTREG